MTPSAVPYSTVARAPVLQMVMIRGWRLSNPAPRWPIRLQAATVSRRIAWASSSGSAAAATRSTAQKRSRAVGRLARIAARPASGSASQSASTAPKAAVTPIEGAPRTTMFRIALATIAALRQVT